jgi:transposase-like protein
MLSEHRDQKAARRFLHGLIEAARPQSAASDDCANHPAYVKAIRGIVESKVEHRQNQYLNNRTALRHRPTKQNY